MSFGSRVLSLGLLSLLSACQHSLPVYLIEQGLMQGSLYMKAVPLDEAIHSENTSPTDKEYLNLAKVVLSYARSTLDLKTKGSYEKFLKLDRNWVTQVVVAAHKDRAEPYLFKFPVFGSLPYRGYFNEEEAQSFAKKIATEKNLDTLVRPVPAYSTTGWLRDPIISTMFRSDLDLAELLFHELVHLQFYFDSEADFNEAFATWFAEKALKRFVADKPTALKNPKAALQTLAEDSEFDRKFSDLIFNQLKKAKDFYAQGKVTETERKVFFDAFHDELVKLAPHRKWPVYPELNNAFLVSSSTYYRKIPLIERFAQSKKLDEKQMLELVRKTGPSIVKSIESDSN